MAAERPAMPHPTTPTRSWGELESVMVTSLSAVLKIGRGCLVRTAKEDFNLQSHFSNSHPQYHTPFCYRNAYWVAGIQARMEGAEPCLVEYGGLLEGLTLQICLVFLLRNVVAVDW